MWHSSKVAKPIVWLGSSLKDLRRFPQQVRTRIGFALYRAQVGGRAPDVKALRGFGDASVLEVVEEHHGEAYRAVYTVRFEGAIYVLHVFEKKSKRGAKTPKPDADLISERLKQARARYERETKD